MDTNKSDSPDPTVTPTDEYGTKAGQVTKTLHFDTPSAGDQAEEGAKEAQTTTQPAQLGPTPDIQAAVKQVSPAANEAVSIISPEDMVISLIDLSTRCPTWYKVLDNFSATIEQAATWVKERTKKPTLDHRFDLLQKAAENKTDLKAEVQKTLIWLKNTQGWELPEAVAMIIYLLTEDKHKQGNVEKLVRQPQGTR